MGQGRGLLVAPPAWGEGQRLATSSDETSGRPRDAGETRHAASTAFVDAIARSIAMPVTCRARG